MTHTGRCEAILGAVCGPTLTCQVLLEVVGRVVPARVLLGREIRGILEFCRELQTGEVATKRREIHLDLGVRV